MGRTKDIFMDVQQQYAEDIGEYNFQLKSYHMKQELFNQYVVSTAENFGVDEDDLFSKTKKREVVDARQMLYYACSKRPMRVTFIQECMAENGYYVGHSVILYGIKSMGKKIDEDQDYHVILEKIQNCITT
jgi:chromosomal replication initiation ATPase DnaA